MYTDLIIFYVNPHCGQENVFLIFSSKPSINSISIIICSLNIVNKSNLMIEIYREKFVWYLMKYDTIFDLKVGRVHCPIIRPLMIYTF